jgi:uncharacterized protein YodC (DUF2158 family)
LGSQQLAGDGVRLPQLNKTAGREESEPMLSTISERNGPRFYFGSKVMLKSGGPAMECREAGFSKDGAIEVRWTDGDGCRQHESFPAECLAYHPSDLVNAALVALEKQSSSDIAQLLRSGAVSGIVLEAFARLIEQGRLPR